jgi:hypothetical protein
VATTARAGAAVRLACVEGALPPESTDFIHRSRLLCSQLAGAVHIRVGWIAGTPMALLVLAAALLLFRLAQHATRARLAVMLMATSDALWSRARLRTESMHVTAFFGVGRPTKASGWTRRPGCRPLPWRLAGGEVARPMASPAHPSSRISATLCRRRHRRRR